MPLSPALFIAGAMQLVDEPGAQRTAVALVDRFMQSLASGGPREAGTAPPRRIRAVCPPDWSTAFVHHVGYWSHYNPKARYSTWPLPPARTAAELAVAAADRGVLVEDAPRDGDVYLLRSPARNGFVRAGIVVELMATRAAPNGETVFDCLTIDADTTRQGAVHGAKTLLLRRRLSLADGDRMVRWVDLARSDRDIARADELDLSDLAAALREESAPCS